MSEEFRVAVLKALRETVKDPYGWLSDAQYLDPELNWDQDAIVFSDGGSLDIGHLAAMMADLFEQYA